jgi:hypothetical protein
MNTIPTVTVKVTDAPEHVYVTTDVDFYGRTFTFFATGKDLLDALQALKAGMLKHDFEAELFYLE